MSQEQPSFKRSFRLFDATMIVAGSMIGSGIFIVSSDIVRNVGSTGGLLLVWIITGLLTVAAAVSYGELSGMFPKAGGQYIYLKEAFNPLVGFLYGWSFFTVIQTGSIAAVGVAFSKFSAYLFPVLSEKNILFSVLGLNISAAQLTSIALIIFLSFINTRGVQYGKYVQSIFTVTKLLALFGLVIFGFILTANTETWHHNWQTGFSIQQLTSSGFLPYTGWAAFGAIAASMVGSLFSSDSWNNVTFIAGEIQNPQRNIGLSLFLGTLIVTSIYLLANIMYVSVLDLPAIAFAENDRVGVVASQHIFGEGGTMIVAVFLMISTFGCDNGLILAGARVYYTMANDGLFFKKVGELNKNGVPEKALWIQCAWASVLCLSGKYGELLDYVIFAVLIFYALTILGIIRLRIKKPELERPYKAFGYPFVPLLYIFTATCICILLLIYKPNYTWPGLGLVLLGIPVFYILKKTNSEL
ncbi:APC family permease [Flectobacillus longus]|uniref:APC family permease n=1 Tax=Flectobacillus longus TaxID=2984207 RepID=UPI0024B66EF9|nr:amino acid permease [Flectobacillus longus]MDI9878874.1 amino acid permease [Flectobacillus longus]